MGVTLCAVNTEAQPSHQGQTTACYIYTNSDLPFENHKDDLKIWQSVVLAGIIDWAGSCSNPWAVGAEPDFDKVIKKCPF